MQRGYPPAVGYPRVGLQEVRHWQKCRGRRIAPAWVSGHPALPPWGPISLAWRVRGDELRYTETRVGVPWPLCVPNGRGGRRVGGGARHLDRGTSRLQGPRRGGPPVPPPLFLKVLILSMCERRPEGRELCGLSCQGGVGTNCIERCVLPNEVRKERGARGPGWRLDAGPSRGSLSTCVACLSPAGPALGGSHTPLLPTVDGAHRAVHPPPASCLWQTLSVGRARGPRGWRWWQAAGVWGEVAWLGGPPHPFCPGLVCG